MFGSSAQCYSGLGVRPICIVKCTVVGVHTFIVYSGGSRVRLISVVLQWVRCSAHLYSQVYCSECAYIHCVQWWVTCSAHQRSVTVG